MKFYIFLLAIIFFITSEELIEVQAQTIAWNGYKISDPYRYKNLTIFLIQGEDKLKGKEFLTLQEALEKKVVIVKETGDVNELEIVNTSKDQEVFIQSGEIVKGGQQDRVMADDFILSPGVTIPVNAFCVEAGRWRGRGSEPVTQFSGSSYSIPSKELKRSVRMSKNQGDVWESVNAYQFKIMSKVDTSVRSSVSPTSLQLSLESRDLKAESDKYINELKGIVNDKNDVIGYVFAINDSINSADIYCSNSLFSKLWDKNLNSIAMESVSEADSNKAAATVSKADVEKFFDESIKAKEEKKNVDKRTSVITRDAQQSIMFETIDNNSGSAWIRRNYMKK